MREYFEREVEGSVVGIEVDMSAYGYSQKFSYLLSVFVKSELLDETKEELIAALEADERAKFVALRVVDGWSELYFYTRDSKGFTPLISAVLKKGNYPYESSVVKDLKWDFHFKNLMPSALELAHVESHKIIEMLQEEGDDLSQERPVEHYLSFETPTQKERFIDSCKIEGFVFKDEIESDSFENGIAMLKTHAVTPEVLKTLVEEIFEALGVTQGYYEGWSTILAKDSVQ